MLLVCTAQDELIICRHLAAIAWNSFDWIEINPTYLYDEIRVLKSVFFCIHVNNKLFDQYLQLIFLRFLWRHVYQYIYVLIASNIIYVMFSREREQKYIIYRDWIKVLILHSDSDSVSATIANTYMHSNSQLFTSDITHSTCFRYQYISQSELMIYTIFI